MMQLRYKGMFGSVSGVRYRVEIWQDAEAPYYQRELTFAPTPLVIEWKDTPKHTSVQGAMATMTLISDTDRQFFDLYTAKPASVQLKVYRRDPEAEEVLYWEGSLDPETYEEPFESYNGYEVSLTFTDFGALDRLDFDEEGMLTLRDVAEGALTRAGIPPTWRELISTSLQGADESMTLEDLSVDASNFYDEDGEPKTWREVLEAVLQPLGLRIIQRAGVFVYDLNALATQAQDEPVRWVGDNSTLGVDSIFNKVRINWSPYVRNGNDDEQRVYSKERKWPFLASYDIEVGGVEYDEELESGDTAHYPVRTYHKSEFNLWDDVDDVGFALWLRPTDLHPAPVGATAPGVSYFKITPVYDGSESEGVAITWPHFWRSPELASGGARPFYRRLEGYNPVALGVGVATASSTHLVEFSPITLPPFDWASGAMIRIRLPLLFDCKVNPFESVYDYTAIAINGSFHFDNAVFKAKEKCERDETVYRGYLYVPALITFEASDGHVYRWVNSHIAHRSPNNARHPRFNYDTGGYWADNHSAADTDIAYLAYYNPGDPNAIYCSGWADNHPTIPPEKEACSASIQCLPAGEYLMPPPPPLSGQLRITILGEGWRHSIPRRPIDRDTHSPVGIAPWFGGVYDPYPSYNIGDSVVTFDLSTEEGLSRAETSCYIQWVLMQLPSVEIVSDNMYHPEVDDDDVEYKAELVEGAAEELSIDTICGSASPKIPGARGAYYLTSMPYVGDSVLRLKRAQCTDLPERLLIGTLCSQYGRRCVTLKGERGIGVGSIWGGTYDPAVMLTDRSWPRYRFLALSERQDLTADVAEVTLVETRPDQYRPRPAESDKSLLTLNDQYIGGNGAPLSVPGHEHGVVVRHYDVNAYRTPATPRKERRRNTDYNTI